MKIDEKKLTRVIEFLETKPVIEMGRYPEYPEEVDIALGMLETDYDYASHCQKINEKGIQPEEMNIKQIRAMLTSFLRGERFCTGYIAEFVENGMLLRLMKRLKELKC